MKSFWEITSLIVCLLVQIGCVDDIELEVNGDDKFMVINGQITDLNESYQVTIFSSASFLPADMDTQDPISNALVTIESSDGSSVILTESEPGIYNSTVGAFTGSVGESYFLNVQMADGREYQSTKEKLLPVAPIGNVYFDLVIEDELNENGTIIQVSRIKVFVETQIPDTGDGVYLKWDVLGEYEFNEWQPPSPMVVNATCYVWDNLPLGEVKILDGSNVESNVISGKEIKSIDVSYKFASNYCLHIRQQALTREAFTFWQQISKSVDRSGGLFEEPAGAVSSNVRNVNDPSERVLGYFQASSVDVQRMFVPKEAANSPNAPCPPQDSQLQQACETCTTLINSSSEKPSYWP